MVMPTVGVSGANEPNGASNVKPSGFPVIKGTNGMLQTTVSVAGMTADEGMSWIKSTFIVRMPEACTPYEPSVVKLTKSVLFQVPAWRVVFGFGVVGSTC